MRTPFFTEEIETDELDTLDAMLVEAADRTEEDGVDWCAWWAEYDQVME